MKSSIDWLELTNNSANPTETDSTRRGIVAVGTSLKFWTGSVWTTVGLVEIQTLDQLSDVTLTTPATGHLLIHDGTDWKNKVTSGDVTIAATGAMTIGAAKVVQAKLSYEVINVTVVATATSGTGTCTSGSIILGYYPTSNQDQFVDSIAISGTTVTVTLGVAATANNTFAVVCLKA